MWSLKANRTITTGVSVKNYKAAMRVRKDLAFERPVSTTAVEQLLGRPDYPLWQVKNALRDVMWDWLSGIEISLEQLCPSHEDVIDDRL